MKRIFVYMMLVAAAFSVQSCLHDDEEVFGESAAVRMQKSVSETKALLESSPAGWLMHYYAGEGYTGVGCTFLMRFQNGKAYVSGDIAPVDMVSSSSYDVVTDQGPVLTFNTYNEIFHYLAQPMQDPVDGEQGDFEFVVMKTEADKIYLTGKKWMNKMVMERLPEGTDWEDYLTELVAFGDGFPRAYNLLIDGEKKGKVSFDTDYHRAVFATEADAQETPYSLLRDGFVLPQPVRIAGLELTSFKSVDGTNTIACTDAGAERVTLQALLDPDYVLGKIGTETIGLGDDAATLTYDIPNGEMFTYTTDAEWLDVTFADGKLTLTVEANDEGHARTAAIIIANEEGEGTLTVTQADFDKDVAGSYLIGYWDADGEIAFSQAVIGRRQDGTVAMNFLLAGRFVMSTALTWDEETASLVWMSGQHLGVYGNYQVFNIFYTDTYWSGIGQTTPLYGPVTYDEEDGSTFAQLGGSINGEEINAVYLMACSKSPLTSTGDFLGYLEVMQYPMLLKMDDTAEVKQQEAKVKSAMQAKRLARPMTKVRQKRIR